LKAQLLNANKVIQSLQRRARSSLHHQRLHLGHRAAPSRAPLLWPRRSPVTPLFSNPPRKYNSLIQAQARELSHLRQTLREGRGVSRSLAQHLRDALRSFEELLRGTDIDYYLGQGFREQLAQGRQLAERLSDKLGTSKCLWGGCWGVMGRAGVGKGCFNGCCEGLGPFGHPVLCGLPAPSWNVHVGSVWGTDSLGYGSYLVYFFFRRSTGWGG
uniref:Uncharacterized protein n=1 Tax=Anas platyrhynchos TaxID=8839 RepID=A0A8B9TI55_ANAPL